MLIKGNPNQIVQRRVRRAGKWRIEVLFEFDDNGEKEIDETVISSDLLERIDKNFRVELSGNATKQEKSLKSEPCDANGTPGQMTYAELKSYAKSLGINTYGMKKEDIMTAVQEAKHE